MTNSVDALVVLSFDVGVPVPIPVGEIFFLERLFYCVTKSSKKYLGSTIKLEASLFRS